MNRTFTEPPPVGEHLKRERLAQRLSLGDLSRASGISKAMLSQIESGRVNPTLVILWKAAQALDLDISVLVSGERKAPEYFHRLAAEEQARIDYENGGTRFRLLTAPGMPDGMEMYHVTLAPGVCHVSEAHADGCREYVMVIRGRVKFASGENSAVLETGDFLCYRGDQTHSMENMGETAAEVHMTDVTAVLPHRGGAAVKSAR